jgi:hypothetical protein
MAAHASSGDVRSAMVELARSFVGCGARSDRARYIALVSGPAECDDEARGRLLASRGCAIVAMGLVRSVGCTHPLLLAPRRMGHETNQDIITIARDLGAWVEAQDRGQRLPEPGDVTLARADTGTLHASVVIGRQGDRLPIRLDTVDGGQIHPKIGGPMIGRMVHTWTEEAGQIVDNNGFRIRIVEGWANIEALHARKDPP